METRVHFFLVTRIWSFPWHANGLLLNLLSSFPNYCLNIHNFFKTTSLESFSFLLLHMILELRCLKIYSWAQCAGFVCDRVLGMKFRWSLQSYIPPTEYNHTHFLRASLIPGSNDTFTFCQPGKYFITELKFLWLVVQLSVFWDDYRSFVFLLHHGC